MCADPCYRLRWDGHGGSVPAAMTRLLNAAELVDVRLCCRHAALPAHKLVLSACSPYFRRLFKEQQAQNGGCMVFYMHDTSASDLRALVEFMYKGSVNVSHSQLASFIKTAEALEIRGLSGQDNMQTAQTVSGDQPCDAGTSASSSADASVLSSSLLNQDTSVLPLCTAGTSHASQADPSDTNNSNNNNSEDAGVSSGAVVDAVTRKTSACQSPLNCDTKRMRRDNKLDADADEIDSAPLTADNSAVQPMCVADDGGDDPVVDPATTATTAPTASVTDCAGVVWPGDDSPSLVDVKIEPFPPPLALVSTSDDEQSATSLGASDDALARLSMISCGADSVAAAPAVASGDFPSPSTAAAAAAAAFAARLQSAVMPQPPASSLSALPLPHYVSRTCLSDSGGGGYPCPVCGKVYSLRTSMLEHLPRHAGLTTCALCGKEHSTVSHLRKHLCVAHHLQPSVARDVVRQMVSKYNRAEQQHLHARAHALDGLDGAASSHALI